MRKEKILGTACTVSSIWRERMERMGFSQPRRQLSIICKCTGIADANQKCKSAGLGDRIFHSDYSTEASNEEAIRVLENSSIAFSPHGHYNTYVTIEQLLETDRTIVVL